MEVPKLDLTFINGEKITIDVAGYALKLKSRVLRSENSSYKLGTFKINSPHYKSWPPISFISSRGGECTVLTETPPVKTPKTITYAVRMDWPD